MLGPDSSLGCVPQGVLPTTGRDTGDLFGLIGNRRKEKTFWGTEQTGETNLEIVSVNITEVCSVFGGTGLHVFSITQ